MSIRLLVILPALASIGLTWATAAEPVELVYVPASTKRVCQLTGNFDRAAGIPTLSQTGNRFVPAPLTSAARLSIKENSTSCSVTPGGVREIEMRWPGRKA